MYYFAYGSNMNTAQMKGRCPAAVKIGKATLVGYKFIINSRGVATIIRSDGDIVEGGLYEATDQCVATLDRYEGVKSRLYNKVTVSVASNGNTLEALCYIAADSVEGQARPGYMSIIREGAADFNLSPAYIKKAFEKYGM